MNIIRWLTILTLAALLSMCVTLWSAAATFSGNPQPCEMLSHNAGLTADMRDAGIPWEVFRDWLLPQLVEAIPDPGSFVKSDTDVAYIMGLFKRVYDEPQRGRAEFQDIVLKDCMKVAAKRKVSV